MTDTEIWEEDWFIDLPNEYKLFYLFIKDKCDHSGMWRTNRRKFSMSVHGKTIHYEEFLEMVNKDPETGGKVNRIIVLDNGKWFITRFISFQLGGKFNIKVGAHRGAFELLIQNGVHLKEVPKMNWDGFENLEMEELMKLAHGKALYRLSMGTHREIEQEQEKEKEKRRKGSVRENQNFKLQWIYDLPWSQVKPEQVEFKGLNESGFSFWKKFVDFIIAGGFQELFTARFVTPSDFALLVKNKGFVEELWAPVITKMLSTGIKPEQNLYFRIQDFIGYVKSGKKVPESALNAGVSNFEGQQKW